MSRKQIAKTKYLAVFATTTLIFIIGLIMGQNIADTKLTNLENIEDELRAGTMAMELQYLLLSENPCISLNGSSAPLSEELYQLGSKLDFMEQTRGTEDPTVIRLCTIGLCLVTGIVPMVVCYLVGWAIVPPRHKLPDGGSQQ